MLYLETIKVQNGELLNLNYHQARMSANSNANLSSITVPDAFSKGIVKCRVIYDSQIQSVAFSHYNYPKIRTLAIIEAPQLEYRKKYADRSGIDSLYSHRGDCDDILIIQNGNLTDTSFCNIVLQSADGLYTPDTPLLCGTKRTKLISEGIVTPKRITVNDLHLYNTIILINSMIDIEDQIKVNIDHIVNSSLRN